MIHIPTLLTDMALIMIVAGIMTLLCKKLRQPVIIGYILAGFLLGPVVSFFPTIGDPENINTLAEIGVVFLMFALGLEFNLHKMVSVGITAVVSATVQVVGMTILGYLAGLLMGWSSLDSLFLGGMLGMSSTIIAIKAIEDAGLRDRPFAGLTIGTLIIEDIAAIFLMLILSTIAVSQSDGASLLITIGLLLVYLVLWLLLGILLVPTLMKRVEGLLNDETLLIVSLALCFGMVWLAAAIGFSSALGAFMAGSLLASTTISERIEKLVVPLKDMFVAIFFVSVGMMVIPATILDYWLPILILTVITILGKSLLLTISMVATGQDLSTSLHGAFAQTQVGEFSFIIATLGLTLGVTSDFIYPVIVAVAVVTTFTTPFLLRTAIPCQKLAARILPKKLLDGLNRTGKDEEKEAIDTGEHPWGTFLKRYFFNFALYAVLIGGIIFVALRLLWPLTLDFLSPLPAGIGVCLLIYLCISPLLPPLLILRRTSFTTLWLQSHNNRFPLLLLLGLRVAAATVAILLPPLIIFDLPFFWLLLIALPVAWLTSRSQWLRGQYLQIAAKFLANLNEKRLASEEGRAKTDWIDAQIFIAEFVCPEGSAAVGRSLAEMDWGRLVHVNVLRIVRGKKHITIPQGSEVLHKNDRLIVSGSKQAMANFALFVEQQESLRLLAGSEVSLRSFIDGQDDAHPENEILVFALKLEKNSPFENRSIRDSNIRNQWHCFLVGLERERVPFIDPSPSMILRAGDTLWVLGTQKMGAILLDSDLI